MATAYLSLGSNLGEKEQNITTAIGLLTERVGAILALSRFYETSPWGYKSENGFLNVALGIETTLPPLALLHTLKQIEVDMGRPPKGNTYQDRIIDIDILLYDDLIFESKELTIPHSLMHKRSFVLQPLNEIAPAVVHPLLNKTISELAFIFT
ncbi:2-amino-4-hydroxy-6-hydroxymethyldihydropteridine pyrophosphokinase [Bacteroidia bacterium]|nr:2-amino-4-hydroxy-6-hydroxymethyldihydropteridine pyrophosphokinase [Bacteroidia bacterium]